MYLSTISVLLVVGFIYLALAAKRSFRCDYQYVDEVEGWLKYHEVPANWYDARLRCHLEGTKLASPLTPKLQEAIQKIANQHSELAKNIYIGVHATFSKGDYFSIEGIQLSQIPHIWAAAEPTNYINEESCLVMHPNGNIDDVNCKATNPYVCYKQHEISQEVNICGTIDAAYVYYNNTGSCYKFHNVPRIYSRAFMACNAEGGYLSIINSADEAIVIGSIFSKNLAFSMRGSFNKDVAYLGFNDWNEHGEWLTIHGETLQEAGYDNWAPGESNINNNEYCGGVYRSTQLVGLNCNNHHAFICEKNVRSLVCDP